MGGMRWQNVVVLIDAARQGDPQAAGSLHALTQPYLLGLAQKVIGPNWPHESVSDLVQETWLRAWRGLDSFQGGGSDEDTAALFRAWLASTLKNVWCNHLRAYQAQRRQPSAVVSLDSRSSGEIAGQPLVDDPPGRERTPSENVRTHERRRLVEQALQGLGDPLDRELVWLRFFEELSFAEIGARLGRDESTIRYHLQRILATLGRQLKGLQ